MLIELRIKNYAVIEDLSLALEPGLVVLTGETGAGKSIIVGALSLVLGERASSDVIRAGEERAMIEAVFEIGERADLRELCQENGLDTDDGLLVLKREINASGRNRAWINGSPATAGQIAEFGEALVDLHGQHEHQALLHAGPQRRILDEFGGTVGLAEDLQRRWAELSVVRRQRRELEERRRLTEERQELLRHQAEEIEGAGLSSPDEDSALAEREKRLGHAEELLERSATLHEAVYGDEGSVYERLGTLGRELQALGRIDPGAEERFRELFDSAYFALQELGQQLAAYRDAVDLSPAALEDVRARIDLLFRLKSKYGPSLQHVIDAARRARAELETLDTTGFELDRLGRREHELADEVATIAERLSRGRDKAAAALGAEVTRLLPELGMPDGRFEVELRRREELASTGAEDVQFLVTVNKGFDPRPLSRVASGGELSRVMLALKTILARLDRTPTLVFDEIDAGIGGIVGQKVAERLRSVADHHQVFVITHLPQIAAHADHHLLVRKASAGRKAATQVSELSGDERVHDLARMLGGDPEREASLRHARALLEAATGAD